MRLNDEAVVGAELTTEGMCRLFGVSRPTLGEWVKKGMPKIATGLFSLADVVQWRVGKTLPRGGGGEDINEERKRLIIEQRRSHELDNALKASELLPADEVASHMMALATIFSGQLDALPPRVAHRLVSISDPLVIQGVLRDECRSIRRSAGEAISRYGDDLADGEDHAPAPGEKRRRVGRRPSDTAPGESRAGSVADGPRSILETNL